MCEILLVLLVHRTVVTYKDDVQGYRALKSDSSTRIVVPGSGSKGAQWIKGEPDFEYSMSVKS